MTVWEHPAFIIVALVGCLVSAGWLIRAGTVKSTPDFECDLCGRRARSIYAKDWRFCPYCGTPHKREKPRY